MRWFIGVLAVIAVAFGAYAAESGEAAARVDKSLVKSEPQRFSVTLEAMGLFRTGGEDDVDLVYHDMGTNPFSIPGDPDDMVVMDMDDLELDGMEFCPRITFRYDISERDGIEASYFGFGILDWESDSVLDTTALGTRPFYMPFADVFGNDFTWNFDQAERVTANYRSELNHNAEVNYRRTCIAHNGGSLLAGSGLLAGLRYLNIDENLEFRAIDGLPPPASNVPSRYEIDTSNDLLGVQIGGVLALNPHKRVRIDLTAKAGFMANMVDKTDAFQGYDNAGNGLLWDNTTDSTEFAFVGDVSLRVSGQVHKNIWLTAGYNGILVDGVALAPDQIDWTELRTDFHKIDYNNVIYHGFNAGVTIKW